MHGAKKFEALKNFSDWVPLSCPKLNPEPKSLHLLLGLR